LILRRGAPGAAGDSHVRTAALIALAGYLPYWLAPHSNMRYLIPLYPFAGLIIPRLLWLGGEGMLATTCKWLVGAIVLKLLVVTIAFPLYQRRYRGENYLRTAETLIEVTKGHSLYTLNVSASGL